LSIDFGEGGREYAPVRSHRFLCVGFLSIENARQFFENAEAAFVLALSPILFYITVTYRVAMTPLLIVFLLIPGGHWLSGDSCCLRQFVPDYSPIVQQNMAEAAAGKWFLGSYYEFSGGRACSLRKLSELGLL